MRHLGLEVRREAGEMDLPQLMLWNFFWHQPMSDGLSAEPELQRELVSGGDEKAVWIVATHKWEQWKWLYRWCWIIWGGQMESSQACLAASEKALQWLDLFPIELQRTSEKLKKKLKIISKKKICCWGSVKRLKVSISAEAKQGKGLTGVQVNSDMQSSLPKPVSVAPCPLYVNICSLKGKEQVLKSVPNVFRQIQ